LINLIWMFVLFSGMFLVMLIGSLFLLLVFGFFLSCLRTYPVADYEFIIYCDNEFDVVVYEIDFSKFGVDMIE